MVPPPSGKQAAKVMTDTPPPGPRFPEPHGAQLALPPLGLVALGTVLNILKCKPLPWRAGKSPQEGRAVGEHPAASAVKPRSNSKLIGGGKEARLGSLSLRQLDSFLISM